VRQKGEKTMNFDGFTACTLDELKARADAQMDKWLETRRIGVAEYDPEVSVIKLYVFQGWSPYEIDLNYLKTAPQLLNMIFHVSGKSWCKDSVMTDFLHCLTWTIRELHDEEPEKFFKIWK
jgi:hypothetical protein